MKSLSPQEASLIPPSILIKNSDSRVKEIPEGWLLSGRINTLLIPDYESKTYKECLSSSKWVNSLTTIS